jgi:hypothetical protein
MSDLSGLRGRRLSLALCGALGLFLWTASIGRAELTNFVPYGNAGDATTPPPGFTNNTATGTFTISARGTDFWGNTDHGAFLFDPVAAAGDFTSVVRVVGVSDPLGTEWGRTGLMVRNSGFVSNSANMAMIIKSGPGGGGIGAILQGRVATGGGTDRPGGEFPGSAAAAASSIKATGTPVWLAFSRRVFNDGQVALFQGRWALDDNGQPGTWSAPLNRWTSSPVLTGSLHFGLAHQSHGTGVPAGVANTATFDNFSFGPLNSSLFPSVPKRLFPVPADMPEGGAGFMAVREVIDNGGAVGLIDHQDKAHASLISGTGTIVTYNAPVIDLWDSGGTARFQQNTPFRVVTDGFRGLGTVDDISLMARGTIHIPEGQGGVHTFVVNSDDGFRLAFPGRSFQGVNNGEMEPWWATMDDENPYFGMAFAGNRGAGDTLGQIDLPPGNHPFILTFHERGGGAGLEFYAARGNFTATAQTSDWQLVGQPGGTRTVNVPKMNPIWDDGGQPRNFKIDVIRGEGVAHNETRYNEIIFGTPTTQSWFAQIDDPGSYTGLVRTTHTGYSNLLHHRDPQGSGCCGFLTTYQGIAAASYPGLDDGVNNDNTAVRFRGQIHVPAELGGVPIPFHVQSDDGFWFNIPGASFTVLSSADLGQTHLRDGGQTVFATFGTGNSNVRMNAILPAGDHDFTFIVIEGGGDSHAQMVYGGAMTDLSGILVGFNTTAGAVNFEVPGGLQLVPSKIPGDLDDNRLVNRQDAVLLLRDYGAIGPDFLGDINNDQVVGLSDIRIMQGNLTDPAGSPVGAAVPEPSSFVLIGLGLLALVPLRRRMARRRAP